MSTLKPSTGSWYQRLTSVATSRFLTIAMHPYALIFFSLLAITDSVLPVLPAEVMAVTLMFLQPQRALLIGTCFAAAASISALIFSLLVQKAKSFAVTTSAEILTAIEHGSTLIEDWGIIALALLAIFPDSPRASVAIATIAGLSPLLVACSVFIGKLILYNAIRYLLENLPTVIKTIRKGKVPILSATTPGLHRLVAFQRLLQRRASQQTL